MDYLWAPMGSVIQKLQAISRKNEQQKKQLQQEKSYHFCNCAREKWLFHIRIKDLQMRAAMVNEAQFTLRTTSTEKREG